MFFKNASLQNKNLQDTDFQGADLSGADLSGANLNGANLKDTNLMFCNLQQASIQDTLFDYSIMTGTNISEIKHFQGASFQGTNWWSASRLSLEEFKQYLQKNFPKIF